MFEQKATIKNHQGIHCRPSAVIIKHCEGFNGAIRIQSEHGDCEEPSILGLMSLGLGYGEEINLQVEGENEAQFGAELVALFEEEFDFTPKNEGS